MLKDIRENREYRNKIICGIILCVFVVVYNFVWLNKSFTMSEGWARVYVEMIKNGKLPYRDYYYFLPLFSLALDFVFWKISFGYFIVFRCLRLLERILITLIIYKILNRKLPYYISGVVSFCAMMMAAGNVYDLVGDYNQTVELLVILLVVCLLKYFEDDNKNIKWLFLSGVIGGIMFGTKQTVVLASAIVFSVMFLFLFCIKEEKQIIRDIAAVLIGAMIPMAILGAYLLFTHSLGNYIYYIFKDTGSKGSLADIIIKSQTGVIKNRLLPFIAIIFIMIRRGLKDYFEKAKYTCIIRKMLMFVIVFLVQQL